MISPEEKKDDDRTWKSCCFEMDRNFVAYFSQLLFSMTMLGFCSVMLVKHNGDCSQSSPYINILSFMLGKILSNVQSSNEK